MIQFTATMVRALAGAPITVLFLLILEKGPCPQAYIRRHTGFSDHTVQDAVELLNDYGLINQTGRYTWQIAAGVQQLPLGFEELPDEAVTSERREVIDAQFKGAVDKRIPADAPRAEEISTGLLDENIRSQNMRPNPLASSRSLNPESREENLPLARQEPSSQKSRSKILAELDVSGIREPARSRLSRLAHVTPELIRAHCQACKSLGQAIYRIEHDWALPKEFHHEDTKNTEKDFILDGAFREASPQGAETREDLIFDEQAESWWAAITERLREHVPKAIFDNYFPFEAPARRAGAELQVLVANHSFEAYVDSTDLNRLASEASEGAVRSVQFVTFWEQP